MRIIVNDQVHLSDIRPSDKPAPIEHLNDRDIYDRTFRIPFPYTEADAEAFLRRVAKATDQHGHRLSNGSLLTVQGFSKRGDIIVDHGWVIAKEFGHLTHGYVVTSHASQGVTVDKVFIGVSSDSFPATYQRTAYVAVTRGKEQAQIFTDDRKELLKAVSRPDDPMSATELSQTPQQKPTLRNRRTFARGPGLFPVRNGSLPRGSATDATP